MLSPTAALSSQCGGDGSLLEAAPLRSSGTDSVVDQSKVRWGGCGGGMVTERVEQGLGLWVDVGVGVHVF